MGPTNAWTCGRWSVRTGDRSIVSTGEMQWWSKDKHYALFRYFVNPDGARFHLPCNHHDKDEKRQCNVAHCESECQRIHRGITKI